MHTESIVPAQPSERTRQIVALANAALSGVDEVRAHITRCTNAALECGRLLNEERAHVNKEHGHGAWLAYYEAHFAEALPDRTARRWMAQSKLATMATMATALAPNELRNQVLTLGLFPPKQHTETSVGNGQTHTLSAEADVTLPKHSTHLGLINRFSAWRTRLKQETGGKLDHEQAAQLLKDFEPIEQFIAELRRTF